MSWDSSPRFSTAGRRQRVGKGFRLYWAWKVRHGDFAPAIGFGLDRYAREPGLRCMALGTSAAASRLVLSYSWSILKNVSVQ